MTEYKEKKFINKAECVVEDLVSSMVLTYAPRLRKVEGFNILVDADVDNIK